MSATIATTTTYKHSLTSQACNHNCEGFKNQTGSRAGARKERGIKAEIKEKQHKGAWWAEVESEICSAGKARKRASAQAELYPKNSCLQSCLLFGFPGLMLAMSPHSSCLMVAGCDSTHGYQQPALTAPGSMCWRMLCCCRKHIAGPREGNGWAPAHTVPVSEHQTLLFQAPQFPRARSCRAS